MIDLKALRICAEKDYKTGWDCTLGPAHVIELLDQLEAAQKDAARIDWLESSKESHGFCHLGYGDYRHYALQTEGYESVREVIDAAMASQS